MAPGVIWTKEECEKLNKLVEHHGKKWTPISSMVGGGKTGKQCRRQWERLNIVTKQCGWSPDEDDLLLEYHSVHGNKWTRIARLIGGRTDNAVKNRYHALRMKNKAHRLPRMHHEYHHHFDANGNRSLKSISSLERREQMRKEMEQARRHARNEGSEGSSSIFIKGEPSQSTGHLSSSFGNAWGLPSCSHEPWIHGSSDSNMQQCPSPFHAPLLACYSGTNDDGGQTGFLMGNSRMHHHQRPTMIPGKVSDDADSMESTSENKTPTTAMDCLATYYTYTSDLCCSMTGTSSNPLPSRVLDSHNPVVESLDRLYKKEDCPIPCTSLSMDVMQPQTMKMPELTVELPVVDLDFESCLNTVSPSSPSFYCKFLNLKNSPVTMMTTTAAHPTADQETRMEA